MTRIKHWQNAATGMAGAWLMVSPWLLGYQNDAGAMANAVLLGLALIAVASGAILAPRTWQAWTQALLGLWLLASPWLLGFAGAQAAVGNAVVIGLAVVVLALWALLRDRDVHDWRDHSPAH